MWVIVIRAMVAVVRIARVVNLWGESGFYPYGSNRP